MSGEGGLKKIKNSKISKQREASIRQLRVLITFAANLVQENINLFSPKFIIFYST